MTSNFSRTIWSERGIDISKLETTDIPNTIRRLKWGNFILPPPQYHPEIVRDFYAALVPETFKESGTVFVRGHKVVITAKLINEHFCTQEVPKTSLMGFQTRIDLRILGPGFPSEFRWDKTNQSSELLYEELHPEIALWIKFINHNLIPSKQTIITPEVSRILLTIKKGTPIDVGRLIHTQICAANDSGSSLLPFPSLITHFCRLSSVTWDSGDLCPPLADLGRVSYNSFAQEQGLPTLPLMKRDRVPNIELQPQGRVPKIEVQPQGRVPATLFQPQVREPAMPFQPQGRPLTTPLQAQARMRAVLSQGRAPTTPVQPQGRVSAMPVQLQMGRVPAMPFQPQGRVPAMPVQPPGRPLTSPWQGRPPMTAVQPQGRVSAMPVQLQHGNTDRPKWVNEITGLLNSLSDTVVGQYNALSTQINNLGMRVASLENALRDEEFEDLDSQSHRRVRPRPTE